MKKLWRTIALSVGMFIIGGVASLTICYYAFGDDLANDIVKFAYDAAEYSYMAGLVDGKNGDRKMWDEFFPDETIRYVKEIEYTFIK